MNQTNLKETLKDFLNQGLTSPLEINNFLIQLEEKTLLTAADVTQENRDLEITINAALKDVALKSVLSTKGKAIWKEIAPAVVDFFHHMMDIIINMTKLNEVAGEEGRHVGGRYGAESRLQLFSTLLGYPALIFGVIYAFVSSFPLALLTTAIIICLTLTAIVVYMRHGRPCPKEIGRLENLTTEMLKYDREPLFIRPEFIERIKNIFENGNGVLLLGGTGCGKSFLVKALTQLIVDGEIDYLKNKQVFQLNTGTLIDYELSELEKKFKSHESEIILFADEVHAAFSKNNLLKSGLSDSLKTFFDKLSFKIIATTKDEYERCINLPENEAFLRRFDVLELPDFRKEELEASLKQYLDYKAPELLSEEGTIGAIIEKAKTFKDNTSEVHAAYSLLKKSIVQARVTSFPELQKTIDELKLKKQILEIDLKKFDSEKANQYLKLTKELEVKLAERKKKEDLLNQMKKIEKLLVVENLAKYTLAENSQKNPTLTNKKKYVANQITRELLSDIVSTRRKTVGLTEKLGAAFIQEIVDKRTC